MGSLKLLIMVCFGIGLSISTLIVTIRMRRRMKKSLKRRVSSLDLVSYRMWNKVEEAEQRDAESGASHPR